MFFSDYEMIETAKLRHWYDVDLQRNYDEGGYREFSETILNSRYISFETSSNYHLIYAYLLENTRILQIFEKMIDKYLIDEEFGISGDPEAVGWIRNSFNLFLSKVEHGNNKSDSKEEMHIGECSEWIWHLVRIFQVEQLSHILKPIQLISNLLLYLKNI
ncbi:MAG: hypothetical protein IPO98_19150 [Saprospiraceae bacterium]|nr:hypothetical protein [Saprospiraceae bacterium]